MGVRASLAALLHIAFWVLESVRFRQPATWRRFGLASQEEADAVAPMAFNQGFYNLFLAAGALAGVGFSLAARGANDVVAVVGAGDEDSIRAAVVAAARHSARDLYLGKGLVAFTMLCMLGAALVLVLSNRRLARAAAIQGGPPSLALLVALIA